jgi:predicted TIM-barrel fold metal-dependent hydrolase
MIPVPPNEEKSMAPHGVVSADSHFMEPADLWQEGLGRKFRDRSPKVIENPQQEGPRYLFVAEGAAPFAIAGGFAAGRSGKDLTAFMNEGYEAARPSGWDPVERIKDQELDGVDAEVLYPTLGMPLFTMTDAELQRACFSVYNDWAAEFCSQDPRRLYGIGLISLEDVSSAAKDVARIAKQGLRGAMIWGAPPEDRPYSDPVYDPFWQAASEHQLPVSLHIIASRGRVSQLGGQASAQKWGTAVNPGVWYMSVIHEIQESLTTLIFGGVLERFPELRIVSAENDTGWIPHFLYRMDHAFEKFSAMMPVPLSLKPSATHAIFGADNYMWASDFPHTDSTFPESHAWIDKNFAGVPDSTRKKIVYDNAVELYRMQLN